ncbi:hypothetical protein PCYB_004340 [Plasmodium cynomolgi strain B]|uniref:CYIR protein n=1 Tax=Plasmodium cynomolgi (strain B) TaxID=1120755 RepID=K6V2Z2_PLACD|nr:hypothetical protein PCYB_004340 [Plasmodium cynomolgi strain B]GAB69685.1 hypothetical protein PCYB_004340 [Plasmodium cynomolgi strain B]
MVMLIKNFTYNCPIILNIKQRYICTNYFVKISDMEKIKNKKELYNFLEIYESIKKTLNNNNKGKKEKYCGYIKNLF